MSCELLMRANIFCHPQIPNWYESEQSGSTKDNPFPLPDAYLASQQKKVCFQMTCSGCLIILDSFVF